MDEGLPIAYEVLDEGVPVFSSDGTQVAIVDHVVAAFAEDIFHGVVIRVGHERKFVAADQIASLHERGVDLLIGPDEVDGLPDPHGAAPAVRVHEPGVKPSRWKHVVDLVTGADAHRRDWDRED